MELNTIIQQLYKRRAKLDELLVSLEEVQQFQAAKEKRVKKRRGRTQMGAEERQQVSQRMKNYWVGRRSQQQTAKPTPNEPER